tara:strand:- start:5100 stop:5378 length:279 start_codon:yes stop_codon:yes gene_type:complete
MTDIVYYITHFIIIYMLLRSLYFIIGAKKVTRGFDFWVIIATLLSGLTHLLLELNELHLISNRFPLGTLFWLGAAQVIYIQSKKRAVKATKK